MMIIHLVTKQKVLKCFLQERLIKSMDIVRKQSRYLFDQNFFGGNLFKKSP